MNKAKNFLKQYFQYTNSKGKISKYLYKKETIEKNITICAREIGVRPSTITKFLKEVGFEGWKDYINYVYFQNSKDILSAQNISRMIRDKLQIMKWIDKVYKKLVNKMAKEILEADSVELIAHGATKGVLHPLQRAINILGTRCDIRDFSDKYVDLSNKFNIVYVVVSLSGKNDYLEFLVENLKRKNDISDKYFITCSEKRFSTFNHNINLEHSNFKLSSFENAIPILQITFVQHVIDILVEKMNEFNPKKLNKRLKFLGLNERIKK